MTLDWTCSCTAMNAAAAKLCEVCGSERNPVRAQACPAAAEPPPTAREEVALMPDAERRALMAQLLPKLAAMEARNLRLMMPARKWNGEHTEAAGDPDNEAHLPHERGTADDLDWRAARAGKELARLRDYCERHGIDWSTGRETGARALESASGPLRCINS